jgi:hypothetical protein
VNCRIETVPLTVPSVVRVSGRLAAVHVPELMSLCSNAPETYRLDLEDLISADRVGLDALRRLRTSGAEVIRMSRFIELLLGDAPEQRAG